MPTCLSQKKNPIRSEAQFILIQKLLTLVTSNKESDRFSVFWCLLVKIIFPGKQVLANDPYSNADYQAQWRESEM